MFKPNKFKAKKKLKSTILFNYKIALRFGKIRYYDVLGEEILTLPDKDLRKKRLATPRREQVTKKIASYKKLLAEKSEGYFHVLKAIYDKNAECAIKSQSPPVHSNLLSLVASIPILLLSYRKIRPNKGATTLGAMLSFSRLKVLKPYQRRFLSSTTLSPDGLSYKHFTATSTLLKQGKYPWGASRRVYIDKPGQPDKKRPITIPPFMDRIVQTAILQVLEAIYEPWFEMKNVSFGFRSRKGVHDAMYAIRRQENKGLFMAIEGDIKGAYDNVDRHTLISILEKRIKDRKFINLMKDRLDYQYFDTASKKYVSDNKGIPQGGIDSPYLWNIYMHEFDVHITDYMQNFLGRLNTKLRNNSQPRTVIVTKEMANLRTERRTLKEDIRFLTKHQTKESAEKQIQQDPKPKSVINKVKKYYSEKKNLRLENGKETLIRKVKFDIITRVKRIRFRLITMPSADTNKLLLRFIYVRYADDWIIIGNFSRLLAEKIKRDIKEWLQSNLKAELAEEKTLITDIRKKDSPAKFLGFEILAYTKKRYAYKTAGNCPKPVLTRTAGTEINLRPDRQRLINRLHMKGYCDNSGNPRPLKFMSTLETFALISRFNAVLLGFGNYYYGFVPKSYLNRWIYIIRFSLLKTLAQKYDTNIKGIFKRFGIRSDTGNTIQYTVTNKFTENGREKEMSKTWTLLTEKDIQKACLRHDRFNTIKENFNTIHYEKKLPPYETPKGAIASVKDEGYLNKIMWINLRTQANFDMPCCLCGSTKEIHMHHIAHIRKLKFSQITDSQPWQKIMYLRNRKQIPVCRECHMNRIHKGTYIGANLKSLLNTGIETETGYDNRLVNLENYINPSEKEYYSKSLEEKGWKYTRVGSIQKNKNKKKKTLKTFKLLNQLKQS